MPVDCEYIGVFLCYNTRTHTTNIRNRLNIDVDAKRFPDALAATGFGVGDNVLTCVCRAEGTLVGATVGIVAVGAALPAVGAIVAVV